MAARHSVDQLLKIRAAVLRRLGGPLKIETLEMEGPRDDEILVRIVASGICHTDIAFRDEWFGGDEPVVLGHEGAGVAERTGAGVKGVAPGDHLVLSYQSCGNCLPCRSGHPTDCERFYEANFGFRRLDGSNALERSGVACHFFGQSSFATYALATERNVVRVAKDIPLEPLAPLGCGLQTGAGTVLNSLAVRAGASIAIFGTGSVGMAAVMAGRIAGAAPIIAVDVIPKRLRLAQELGATHTIDGRRKEIGTAIAAITGNGVDHALEITGNGEMYRLALKVVKPGGSVAMIAAPGGNETLPDGRKIVGIIQGDAVPKKFIPRLIELYREGRFPFDRLIKFYDFEDINRAMADSRRGVTIKPVLRIGTV